jgi:Flp pilus assembly protein TadD
LLAERVSVASPERVQSDGLRKQASILLETKRYAEAISYARRALELFPDDPRLYVLIAYAMARAKNNEALDWARKAIAMEPDNPLWYGALSDTFRLLGKWKAALEPIQKAVAMNPENASFQRHLGFCLMHRRKFKDAIPHLERALELNPRDPYTHRNLGIALIRTRHKAEGEQHIRKALELAPEDPEMHASLGWDMLRKGKHKEANEAFREALRLNPENSGAKLGLGDPEGRRMGWRDHILRAAIRLVTIPHRFTLAILHLIVLELIIIFRPPQLGPLNVIIASWCLFFIISPAAIKAAAKRRGIHLI